MYIFFEESKKKKIKIAVQVEITARIWRKSHFLQSLGSESPINKSDFWLSSFPDDGPEYE